MTLRDDFDRRHGDHRIGNETQIHNGMLDEKMLSKADRIERCIGVTFKNKALLLQAFTHRSYLNEHSGYQLGHNERLEYLGDAVLELAVTDYLIRNFPNNEGDLTSWRGCLVGGKHLCEIAQTFGIEMFMLKGRQLKETGDLSTSRAMTNAMEALIGALYFDQGFAVAKDFVDQHICTRAKLLIESERYLDLKSKLQELVQANHEQCRYILVQQCGPTHSPSFISAVIIGKREMGRGKGSSIKESEIAAARQALRAYLSDLS